LGKQESAPIANIWIIMPELVTVIAQRQWLWQRAIKGLELSKTRDPIDIRKPYRSRAIRVGVTQRMFGKARRTNGVGKILAQFMDGSGWTEVYSPISAPKWV
jgi:hypothetical protein